MVSASLVTYAGSRGQESRKKNTVRRHSSFLKVTWGQNARIIANDIESEAVGYPSKKGHFYVGGVLKIFKVKSRSRKTCPKAG